MPDRHRRTNEGGQPAHAHITREGGRLVPLLLSAKRRVGRKASRYASIKVRQWLAQAAVEAGQLHLAYEECQAALDQIEQIERAMPC